MKRISVALAGVIAFAPMLSSCSLVELSGTMTRKTGEVMTDYSKQNDGIVGKAAGFGGRVNTAVGSTVEDVAKKGKTSPSDESKSEQFVSANKRVISSAYDAAADKATKENGQVVKAQKRLQELGYDVGAADGIIGSKTKTALGRYQAKTGLPVTKAFDRATLASLGVAEK